MLLITIMNDIIVIGGGPNGIFCLKTLTENFPLKKILLIEKEDILSNIKKYPNLVWHSMFNELCFDDEFKHMKSYVNNDAVVKYYEEYFDRHKLKYLNDFVIDIKKSSSCYDLILSSKKTLQSKYIILCTGIFENKRKLSINTSYPYIDYNYPDFTTKKKHLTLIGGGNSALDYIIYLLPYNKITWILKSTYTRNSAHLNKFLNVINKYNNNLSIYENTNVTKFNENNSLLLSNNKVIENIDQCNILIGFTYKNALCNNIGINYTNYGYIKISENYETNMKNIFVFGSLSSQDNDMVYIHNGNPNRLAKIISVIN